MRSDTTETELRMPVCGLRNERLQNLAEGRRLPGLAKTSAGSQGRAEFGTWGFRKGHCCRQTSVSFLTVLLILCQKQGPSPSSLGGGGTSLSFPTSFSLLCRPVPQAGSVRELADCHSQAWSQRLWGYQLQRPRAGRRQRGR